MRPLLRSFEMFLCQIYKDSMLLVVCAAPILAGCFFHFGIPFAEGMLCNAFEKTAILADYYLLFDLFLCIMTPYMFCYVSSMVMLTEYDENMIHQMAVTPVGKKGYLVSRLLFPAALSFFASVLILLHFSLTVWSLLLLLLTCFLSAFLSISNSLLMVSFSHNRVEGMAIAKMSGLLMVGLPIPFFMLSGMQYFFSFLPSFWMAKLCIEQNYVFSIPAIITLFLWGWVLYKKFTKKII